MKSRSPRISTRAMLRVEELELRTTPALTIRFDYSFDTAGFFNDPTKRAVLEQAASDVTARITDSIGAIAPSGSNSWTAKVYDSSTQTIRSISNLTVNANELVIYLTSGNIGGALAVASSGGYSSSGSADWLKTVRTRGETGVDSGTDYSTWGGLIAFNNQYDFSYDNTPTNSQWDLKATAEHELMHVLGFGLNNASFTRYTNTGSFTGPNAVALMGTPIAMSNDGGDPTPDHLAQGIGYKGTESIVVPSLMAGVTKSMTELEYAILQDIGWDSSRTTSPPPVVVPPPPVVVPPPPVVVPPPPVVVPPPPVVVSPPPVVPPPPVVVPPPPVVVPPPPVVVPPPPVVVKPKVKNIFIAGNDAGGTPVISAYTTNGMMIATGEAFSTTFRGGVRSATGDVNGDGVSDFVFGAGPTSAPIVKVVDGKNGVVLYAFFAFDVSLRTGVYVAAGDVNADGKADIAVSIGSGVNAKVRVFSGADGKMLSELNGIANANSTGAPQIAIGDINGDGNEDLVVASGEGGPSSISIWNGKSIAGGGASRLAGNFTAFDNTFLGGTSIAVADIDGDGRGDIIAGKGAGDVPTVRVFTGASILANTPRVAFDFNGVNADYRGGIRVATADLNGDGREDIIVAPGANSDGTIRVYSSSSLSNNPSPSRTINNPDWAKYGALVG